MARKKKHPEHENLERWLVSYADFITLLFAFFTVMYALSLTDKAKYKAAVESIQRSFLSGGGVFPLRGTPFVPFEKPPDRGSLLPPSPNDDGKYSKAEAEALAQIAQNVRGLLQNTMGSGVMPAQVQVVRSDEGYKIRLGEVVFFRKGSAKLKRESIPFLFELGKRLVRLGLPIQVEGHTDNTTQDTQKSNWQLSVARAYTMVQFLVEGTEFPENKISIAGYGDTQPLASNDTDEGRAKNRRVEISVFTPDKEVGQMPW